MTDREAMKLAFEALKTADKKIIAGGIESDARLQMKNAITALRQALEQPEQVKRVCNTCNGTGMVKGLHNWATGGKREQSCWNCHEVANEEKEPTLCDVGSEGYLYVQENNTVKAIENRLCDLERRMEKLETLEQPEQEPATLESVYEIIIHWDEGGGKRSRRELARRITELYTAPPKQPEQEPVAWRNAAIRLGEDLYSVGPNGYYDMTASQWLDWALSVVNTAPPKREWVGLTDDEVNDLKHWLDHRAQWSYIEFALAIEAKLKEKNHD